MSHGRVGRELQDHYDVLLHLLCEHQRRLQEKILFRPAGGDRGERAGREGRGTAAERGRKEESGEAAVGVSGDKKRRRGRGTDRELEGLSRTEESWYCSEDKAWKRRTGLSLILCYLCLNST